MISKFAIDIAFILKAKYVIYYLASVLLIFLLSTLTLLIDLENYCSLYEIVDMALEISLCTMEFCLTIFSGVLVCCKLPGFVFYFYNKGVGGVLCFLK
jgi:hypothetical protein